MFLHKYTKLSMILNNCTERSLHECKLHMINFNYIEFLQFFFFLIIVKSTELLKESVHVYKIIFYL